jgi:hypothetical protein
MKKKTKTLATINNIGIVLIDGTEKLVPIRPICDILNINHSNQITKIQNDEFLCSTGVLSTAVGADGKQREMFCLPYKYALGWLFTINPKNVKDEAREIILKYKMECYTALFNHFSDQTLFLEQKQAALEKQLEQVEQIRTHYSNQKKLLSDAKRTLNDIKEMTFEQWQLNKRQLSINFPN